MLYHYSSTTPIIQYNNEIVLKTLEQGVYNVISGIRVSHDFNYIFCLLKSLLLHKENTFVSILHEKKPLHVVFYTTEINYLVDKALLKTCGTLYI